MQFKKVLIFTVCFMIGGFAVDLFASETNNYKNRLILGGRLNALDTTSEYNEDDYKIANNIELEDIGVSFELNAKYKIYFNKAEQNSFFITHLKEGEKDGFQPVTGASDASGFVPQVR